MATNQTAGAANLEALLRGEDPLANVVVARNGSLSWTRSELDRLFSAVSPKPNWKAAIDAVVELANDRELLGTREAVVFFAGCVPTLEALGRNRYRVRAVGYYAAIGA